MGSRSAAVLSTRWRMELLNHSIVHLTLIQHCMLMTPEFLKNKMERTLRMKIKTKWNLFQRRKSILFFFYLCSTKKMCPVNCNHLLVLSVSILEMWKDRQVRASAFTFSNTERLVGMPPSGLTLHTSSALPPCYAPATPCNKSPWAPWCKTL